MCGTRKIPHSCHRKKVWRFFLSCTASQISVEHSNLVFSILHVSSMHSHFRFAAFISLRVHFSDVCGDTAIWFTTFDPITPIGFFYVRGVRHFVVAFLFLCLVVVSLSLRCLSPLPSWRAWRSTCSRNDKFFFYEVDTAVSLRNNVTPLFVAMCHFAQSDMYCSAHRCLGFLARVWRRACAPRLFQMKPFCF